MRDSWFVGIDGKEVTVSWMGLDDNSPSGLYGGSGALVLYGRYLDNQPPLALNLTPPEDIAEMAVDADGNFVCNGVGVTGLYRSGQQMHRHCADSRYRLSSRVKKPPAG